MWMGEKEEWFEKRQNGFRKDKLSIDNLNLYQKQRLAWI